MSQYEQQHRTAVIIFPLFFQSSPDIICQIQCSDTQRGNNSSAASFNH